MVQIEIEGETRNVDEEKIERLVKYEDAVVNAEVEVSSPNRVPFQKSIATHIPTILKDYWPNPTTGVIYDVDVDNPDNPSSVTIQYKYQGQTDSDTYDTDSQEYANLMNYLGLYPHQIMELPGNRVPIDEGRTYRSSREINPPENTAFWARTVFKTTRLAYRFNFLEQDTNRDTITYELTNRGMAWGGIAQFFAYLFFIALLPSAIESSQILMGTLSIMFLLSVLVAIAGVIAVIWGSYQTISSMFTDFSKTDGWPL